MFSRVVFSALLLSGRLLLWETLLGPSLVTVVSVLLLLDTDVTAVGCVAWYYDVPVVIVVSVLLLFDTDVTAVGCAAWYYDVPVVIVVSVLLLFDTDVTAMGCAAWYYDVPVVTVVFIILLSSKSLLLEAVLSLEVFQQQIVVSRLLLSGRLLP